MPILKHAIQVKNNVASWKFWMFRSEKWSTYMYIVQTHSSIDDMKIIYT